MTDKQPPSFPNLSSSADDAATRAERTGSLFSRTGAAAEETVVTDAPVAMTPTAASSSMTMNSRWRWAVVGVATVLVVGLLGAVFVLAGPRSGTPSTVARYAPADTAVYMEARLDLPGDQGQQLASFMSHFPGFADQGAFQAKVLETLNSLTRMSGSGLDWQTDIDPWFGGQVGLFMATVAPTVGTPTSMTMAFSVKQGQQAVLDAWLTPLLGTDWQQSTYEGQTIWTGAFPDSPSRLSLASNDEALVVSLRVEDLQEALDVRADREPGMADDQFFLQQLAKLHDDRLGAFYVNYGQMLQALPSGASMLPPGCFDDVISQAGDLKFIGEARAQNDHLVFTERVQVPTIAGVSAAPNYRPADIAARAPQDAVLFYELPQLGASVRVLVKELLDCAGAGGGTLDPGSFQTLLGTAPEDFFDFVVDAALIVTNNDGLYGGGIVATVDDETVARVRVERLLTAVRALAQLGGAVTIEERQHGQATITVIRASGLPAEVPFQSLALTVTGGHLVMGLDDFVTRVIDQTAADSLAATPRFKAALAAAGGANSYAAMFLDIGAIRASLEGLIPPDSRAQYDSEIKPFVEPIDYLMVVGDSDNGIGVSHMFLYVK